jgi:pilus assembly protein CpaC
MRCNVVAKSYRIAALALAWSAPLCLLGSVSAQAQEQSLHAGTLEVPLNKSQVVSTDRPIARAMIGNADIADVLPITDRSIYVLGKKMGTTSLTLYDSQGRVLSIMDVAVGPDVFALREQIAQLVPGETIDAAISNEAIVLTGTVSNAAAADRAFQLAKAYAGDKVINLVSIGATQQVMVEVRFAEVTRNTAQDIGVRFGATSRGGTFSGVTGGGALGSGTTGSNPAILGLSPLTDTFGIIQKSFGLGGLSINASLNALENKGLVKTLAQPTLIALSGEKASFLAGGEFPVPVAQSGNNTNGAITVEFKPFGVSLAFTPTVLADRTISMIVEPEVSAIDPTSSLTVGNISIPGLRTRRASTTLELRDGESFAIAGLLQKDFQTTIDQVPLLSSIPILGALFRSSSFKKGETELLIVVTPHLVAPIRPNQVKLPTDRVQDPREGDTFLLGESYRPQPVEPAAPGVGGVPVTAGGNGTADVPAAKTKEDGYAF